MQAYNNYAGASLKLNFEKLKTTFFLTFTTESYVHQNTLIVYLKAYANHLKGVQVIETISLQCNSLSQIHSSMHLLQDEISMESELVWKVLTQVWLNSIKKRVSYLTNNECTKT